MSSSIQSMRGIVPPLVTPLQQADVLDVAALAGIVERCIAAGVAGLFVLGTTGEGPNITERLRREAVAVVTQTAKSRVPVLVGISSCVFEDAIALAKYGADVGASAVVAAPPFYHKPTAEELRAWGRAVALGQPLPVFLYNMPGHTRTWFDFETLKDAMTVPSIIGFKDSGGDLTYFDAVRKLRDEHRPEWTLFVGPEHLTRAATGLGGDGGVNGGANLFPELFVELFKAADKGRDPDKAEMLHQLVISLGGIYSQGTGESGVILGLKAALAHAGLARDTAAVPFGTLPPDKVKQIQSIVDTVKGRLRELKV